ncbi:MAG: LysE family transporter [Rhodospirillales bacterium]|nr:LysE family transporter [Rhodospirillales bacterium]
MENLVAFLLAGLALTGSPGPATLSIAAMAAAFGARRGLRYMIGVIGGIVIVMAVTAGGVTGLVLAISGAAPVVTVLAAAYIVYLAYRIATAPPLGDEAGARRPPSFLGGFFLSLANPKAYAAMAALFSGFVLLAGQPAWDALLKGAILLAMVGAVNIAWLSVGARLSRAFRNPATNRAINLAFAVLLLASVVLVLLL